MVGFVHLNLFVEYLHFVPYFHIVEEQIGNFDLVDYFHNFLVLYNLGYTLAMLPDMIMGMLTGQNKNLTLHKGALPLLMVFGSLFCHNPIMKYLLLGLGGLGFLGQSNKELQGREGTSRTLSTYKRYPDEPTDGRIVFNGIKGQDIAVTIDGNPFVVQLDPLTIDSYNRGAVSQGSLCNAVLRAYDEQHVGVSERYEQAISQQEEQNIDQTLALK